nr:protein flowering locus d [Quercus suber]
MSTAPEIPETRPSPTVPSEGFTSIQDPSTKVSGTSSPIVHDQPLGRTKRKRTSPEDQAILEAAYARDPKPDKAKRLELVKVVALGEKEVQNRRQSSRRKCRPLLPHEIAQYHLSRTAASGYSDTVDCAEIDRSNINSQTRAPQETDKRHVGDHDQFPCVRVINGGLEGPDHVSVCEERAVLSTPASASKAMTEAIANPPESVSSHVMPVAASLVSSEGDVQSSQGQSTPIGYFANRRSEASFSSLRSLHSKDDPFMNLKTDPHPDDFDSHAAELTRKKPPRVHLSMSSEGKATVTTKDDTSPSPARAKQPIRYSAGGIQNAELQDKSNAFELERKPLQRSGSGRSRDSRAWEFWCDKDSRTELECRAEKEASGSAADAIGLLRSSSGRSILGPLANKRNPTLLRDTSETKKPRLGPVKRPLLQRASTSFGRLQGKPTHRKQARPSLKYSESAVSIYIPGNDSDKENWSPERNKSIAQDKESWNELGQGPVLKATEVRERKVDIHNDPEADSELAHFMRSGRKSVSSEDDLDCVQGLLSLSQDASSNLRMWSEHHNYHINGSGISRIQQDLLPGMASSQSYKDLEDMHRLAAGKVRQVSVAIVGAGFAGLRAADILLRHGVSVTIYEARDRVGGRVAQSNHLGRIVDLGPNWIHGSNNNPIMHIAKATKTELHTWDEAELLYNTDGKVVGAEEAAEYSSLLWEDGIIADAFRYSEQNHSSIDSKRSLYDFFVEKVPTMFDKETADEAKRKRETLLQLAKVWGAYVGDSVTTQSLKFFWLEECIEGENPFVAGTYSKILEEVASPAKKNSKIHLKTRVTGISNSTDQTAPSVSVKTASGLWTNYDEVIVTSPLGWLKRNKDIFTPPLSPRLSQAIDDIGYGNLDKVYITFPSAFWNDPPSSSQDATHRAGSALDGTNSHVGRPQNQRTHDSTENPHKPPGAIHWLAPSYASDTNPEAWPFETMNLAALPPDSAHPTLLFYIYGACAKYIASLIAGNPATAHLEKLLPFFTPYITRLPNYDAADPACTPTALLATAWANDELAGYGSYSNFQTGLEHGDEDVEIMRHGMPERRVWFAGEHTSPFVALGTSTGAYWSGEKVARRIARAYGLGKHEENLEP